MKVLIFQHTPEESPGTIMEWAQARHLPTTVHTWYSNGAAPDIAAHDILIILGGPMNVDQERDYPWLAQEKIFIRDWIAFKRPVLGICLGGQLLAQSLGGVVSRAEAREIGFQSVMRTATEAPALARWPSVIPVYQYHEDRFSLPSGCSHLLTSPACEYQAFARGNRLLALQFHPESTAEWIRLNAASIVKAEGENYVQAPAETDEQIPTNLAPMTESFFNLLDDFVSSWS